MIDTWCAGKVSATSCKHQHVYNHESTKHILSSFLSLWWAQVENAKLQLMRKHKRTRASVGISALLTE